MVEIPDDGQPSLPFKIFRADSKGEIVGSQLAEYATAADLLKDFRFRSDFNYQIHFNRRDIYNVTEFKAKFG